MTEKLTPPERLIVALDYDPSIYRSRKNVRMKIMEIAEKLRGTGVIIKVNSALRALGYDLIDELHALDLRVFADLKLIDTPKTMEFDGKFLREAQPYMVTAMCCDGVDGLRALEQEIPATKVLGVTVLTTLDEEDCQGIFGCSTKAGVLRFARMAQLAGISDLILSPKEAEVITKRRSELKLELNTPNIRPEWAHVEGDDQNEDRKMTPREAIVAGATRVVIGRPITGADNPLKAVHRTLQEIELGMADIGVWVPSD